MSEKLKNSGEKLEYSQEEETDYPEFQGKKDEPEKEEIASLTVEEAREQARKAILDKKKEKEKELEGLATEREEYEAKMMEVLKQENIPDDIDEISTWIDSVDTLPAKNGYKAESGYDGYAHRALSKKHGGDMLPEDREKAYAKLEQWYDKGPGHFTPETATDIMLDAIKNAQATQNNEKMDSSKKDESIKIEKEAAKLFEEKAVESRKGMSPTELEEYARNVQDLATDYAVLADLTEQWSETSDRKESERIKETARRRIEMWKMKVSFPCYEAKEMSERYNKEFLKVHNESKRLAETGEERIQKPYEVKKAETLKYLYEIATKQKEKVTGFGNKRRLKKDEKLILPDSFEDVARRSDVYDADRLRSMIAEYISMQK